MSLTAAGSSREGDQHVKGYLHRAQNGDANKFERNCVAPGLAGLTVAAAPVHGRL